MRATSAPNVVNSLTLRRHWLDDQTGQRRIRPGPVQRRLNARAELVSPIVWVDVEPTSIAPWTKNIAANKAVIDGVLRGYQAAGFKVGIYSNRIGYRKILGSTRYGLPEWRTAGPRCRDSIRSWSPCS